MVQRAQKVAQLIQEEIGRLIQRGVKDPRIGFVTVTDVEVSEDLRHANVYVSVYGSDKAKEDSLAGLESAKGFIRSELGKHLRLRHTPELNFKYDQSVEYGARINKVINDLKREEGEDDE